MLLALLNGSVGILDELVWVALPLAVILVVWWFNRRAGPGDGEEGGPPEDAS